MMAANPQPDQRLSTLLILLSLDGVVPLYAEIGFPLDDRRAFLQSLRKTILENRRIWESGADQPPALAALLLRNLQTDLGPQAARAFLMWSRTVFLGVHAEQPEWSAWEIVFSQWAYNDQLKLSGLPEARRDELLLLYRDKTSDADIKDKIRELGAHQLSEWDLDMYARHGYGIEEDDDPYLTVRYMIKIRRLQEFWEEASPGLSEADKEVLLTEGRKVIERLGVWMPAPLQSLDELKGQLQ